MCLAAATITSIVYNSLHLFRYITLIEGKNQIAYDENQIKIKMPELL